MVCWAISGLLLAGGGTAAASVCGKGSSADDANADSGSRNRNHDASPRQEDSWQPLLRSPERQTMSRDERRRQQRIARRELDGEALGIFEFVTTWRFHWRREVMIIWCGKKFLILETVEITDFQTSSIQSDKAIHQISNSILSLTTYSTKFSKNHLPGVYGAGWVTFCTVCPAVVGGWFSWPVFMLAMGSGILNCGNPRSMHDRESAENLMGMFLLAFNLLVFSNMAQYMWSKGSEVAKTRRIVIVFWQWFLNFVDGSLTETDFSGFVYHIDELFVWLTTILRGNRIRPQTHLFLNNKSPMFWWTKNRWQAQSYVLALLVVDCGHALLDLW